jgi:hypothetical protein
LFGFNYEGILDRHKPKASNSLLRDEKRWVTSSSYRDTEKSRKVSIQP